MRNSKYFKQSQNGYIFYISQDIGGIEISENEYSTILSAIRNCPTAPDGYGYRLREDLSWELYELPIIPPTEEAEELTYDEILEALAEAEYELCLWELGIHDDFETEEI